MNALDEYNERVDRFLEELEALQLKFNFAVSACGCCGSPHLLDLEDSPFRSLASRFKSSQEYYDHLRNSL